MRLIVCIDDRGGMTFNRRRQSRDRVLCTDVVQSLGEGERLLTAEYSRSLFDGICHRLVCCDDFLDIAGESDVCFVENRALLPYMEKTRSITIYHWNRHYPADTTLDIDPLDCGFSLTEVKEFEGFSHKKITKEIYGK